MYLFCGFYSAEIVQDSDEGGALNECTVNFDQSLPTRHQVSISLHSFNPNISMQFLHTFLPTFHMLHTRRIRRASPVLGHILYSHVRIV